MSECKVYRREIDEAADGGALSPDARAHLALCRACGEGLRERESLRALVGGLDRVGAPADFEFRLRARMAAAKSGAERNRFAGSRWFYGFAPFAVAACFVVVSATLYLKQAAQQRTTAPPVASLQAPSAEPDRGAPFDKGQGGPVEAPSRGVEIVKAVQAGSTPPKFQKAARRSNARALQSRELVAQGMRREAAAPQNTLVSSVSAAPILLPKEPLRVILRDERGAERVVPMRSVSFGSQDFLSRGASSKTPTVVEVGGVW